MNKDKVYIVMKVYIVVYDGAYGTVIESVFSDKTKAQKYCQKLEQDYHYEYRIIEKEVN
jgi:hypothetical protein